MNNEARRTKSANRYNFSNTLEQLRPRELKTRISPRLKRQLFALALIVVVFGVTFAVCLSPAQKMDARSDAFYSARQFVAAKLKAPATAVFCAKSDATVSKDGARTIVSGYVDSSNSFGATIRSRWSVALNADGSLSETKIR